MTKTKVNPKVEDYVREIPIWREVTEKLRTILLDIDVEITEEFKWHKPCYSVNHKNIVLIQGFKAYCALLFFKGSLLTDPERVLVDIGENSRVGKQLRFTSVKDVERLQKVIKAYVLEAIQVEKAGLKVEKKEKANEIEMPEEFAMRLEENASLKAAFEALTPGRRKAYLYYFAGAKQSKTREARIEKFIPQILNGKGLRD
ncbi:YdeI/OmpD-associated family protein [Listeria valentina]|uniref:YdeI/OmpD-associated family protein n=1 Tax=Listeria valentina TaxID=2705293 RepID=UPI001431A47A|nr:YdeI/OmpD-associated family protein [Listeria valentina]